MRMGLSIRDMLILAGLLAAAAVLYFVLLAPAASERTRLTAEAKRLTRQSQKMQEALKAITPRQETGGNRLAEIRGRFLPRDGLPQLLAEISRPSQRHGVRIVSFTPKESGREISVDLVLEGTYLQLGRYFEDLLEGPYVFAVANIQLRAKKPGDTSLRMKLTLKSWMQDSSR